MKRWGLAAVTSLGLAAVFVGAPLSAQPMATCNPNHPDQAYQKRKVLTLARDINTAEAKVFSEKRAYQPLSQLQLVPIPQGFDVRLTTDGASYGLSAGYTMDPCHVRYFSDQDGKIFAGQVIQ